MDQLPKGGEDPRRISLRFTLSPSKNRLLAKSNQVFAVAVFAFILGRYSETFSGSNWAWIAVVCAVFVLVLNIFFLLRDFWAVKL